MEDLVIELWGLIHSWVHLRQVPGRREVTDRSGRVLKGVFWVVLLQWKVKDQHDGENSDTKDSHLKTHFSLPEINQRPIW